MAMIWLTDDLKAKHLRELAEAESTDLDDGAMPLLSQINAINGLVTTGCCLGHSRTMRGADQIFENVGYVSIRAAEFWNDKLEQTVIPELLEQPFMDHVAKVYERDEEKRPWCRFVFAFKRGCAEKFLVHFKLNAGGDFAGWGIDLFTGAPVPPPGEKFR